MTHKRRIRYKHPNYPGAIRSGVVLYTGKDGCTVRHDETQDEERVRHEDIVGEAGSVPDGDEGEEGGEDFGKSLPTRSGPPLLLLKSGPPRSQSPVRRAAVGAKMQMRLGKTTPATGSKATTLGLPPPPPVTTPEQTLPQWAVPRPPAHDIGHVVQYQRPDMAVPEVGKIESMGRHGAMVSSPSGAWRQVRHEHILGTAMAHARPEEHPDALDTLGKMGVPIDETDKLMIPGATEDRPTAALLERVKALAGDGAPIDAKRAGEMSASVVRRAIERFTGPLPADKLDEEPKPKSKAKDKDAATPAPTFWREEEE